MITYEEVKDLVNGKLIDKTNLTPYEDLSERLFGEGNCFNESEVRKRMYGMKRLIEIIEADNVGTKVETRILSLSDLHVPFNLPIDYVNVYAGKVDVLVLNGDIEDCQSCSKFPKKYRVDVTAEMIQTRQIILDLVAKIKPKKVVVVKGNHEHRMGRYLSDRLNEDLMNLMPDTPMDLIINDGFKNRDRLNKTEVFYPPLALVLAEEGVEISYTGDWWRRVGNTIFAHPLSYSSGMLKTTEKAVEYFLRVEKDFDTLILGHTHKLGSYIQGNIHMYEQGCLCDLNKLAYNDGLLTIPNQNGFIYLCQDKDGNLIEESVKLINL